MKSFEIGKDTLVNVTFASIDHFGFGIGAWQNTYGPIKVWTICIGPINIYISKTKRNRA